MHVLYNPRGQTRAITMLMPKSVVLIISWARECQIDRSKHRKKAARCKGSGKDIQRSQEIDELTVIAYTKRDRKKKGGNDRGPFQDLSEKPPSITAIVAVYRLPFAFWHELNLNATV